MGGLMKRSKAKIFLVARSNQSPHSFPTALWGKKKAGLWLVAASSVENESCVVAMGNRRVFCLYILSVYNPCCHCAHVLMISLFLLQNLLLLHDFLFTCRNNSTSFEYFTSNSHWSRLKWWWSPIRPLSLTSPKLRITKIEGSASSDATPERHLHDRPQEILSLVVSWQRRLPWWGPPGLLWPEKWESFTYSSIPKSAEMSTTVSLSVWNLQKSTKRNYFSVADISATNLQTQPENTAIPKCMASGATWRHFSVGPISYLTEKASVCRENLLG